MDTVITATWIDYAVIILYFVGILWIGTLFGKFTKSTNDFFFGGQRFSWWLIAMSCVATVVGSYSFIKYAAIGYKFGFSSTMTYLNDWFVIPIFILAWLPIIFFNRIASIPEYFRRRYDEKTKLVAIVYIMVFMVGYVGINLYTLGVALQPLLKINLYVIVVIVAIVGAIYLHAGGQTSVIMTDLMQGFILIIAGFMIFGLGIYWLGGFENFLSGMPLEHKLPFANFNQPAEFNFVGIFWQDAAASTMAFYFMNQGVIMRFMSARNPQEGRKAVFAIVLVLMPLAVLAIANTGWIGRSMVSHGMLPASVSDRDIFMAVTNKITTPGIFGFVLAALTAALMSTIDTLINAISAVFVNDIWRPYIRKDAPDGHYLHVARIVAILAAVLGVALVPFFASFKSIYEAHGTFTASITPPVVTLIILSILSKRITATAAFWSMILGFFIMLLTMSFFPQFIQPIAHGIDPARDFKYIRALYGILVTLVLAFGISAFTKRKTNAELSGLVIDSVHAAKVAFKGGEPNDEEPGETLVRQIELDDNVNGVHVTEEDRKLMEAELGDLMFISDTRWWLGGLKSVQLKLTATHSKPGVLVFSRAALADGHLKETESVTIQKFI
ncbi:MAG: sodium/solute symporter [Leptospiraceae bacterium]|nr:sodium/solute symporter [Leptospiraceae bacterium]